MSDTIKHGSLAKVKVDQPEPMTVFKGGKPMVVQHLFVKRGDFWVEVKEMWKNISGTWVRR